MKNSSSLFEEQLSREILRSEKFRAIILGIISGILALYILIIYLFFNDYFFTVLGIQPPFLWTILIFAILTFRSFFISKRLDIIYERHRKFYWFFRYSNAFIEASVPTIILFIFVQTFDKASALLSPPVILYSVFIILSILELDFKLCIFTGFVAAAEYAGLANYFLHQASSQEDIDILLNSPSLYNGKSMLIFLSGIIAGLISLQIKKRIFTTYKTLDEKNRLEKLFGQQISPEIVEEMIQAKQEITSRRRNVCIMFLDIRDFTSFSEKKSPEEIVQYQNDVFSFMIEIVNHNHGIINQILGDGFMATFGAPISKLYDCQNAFNASMEILNELKRKNEAEEIPYTKVGIGLHFGEAITGNVGTTIRKQYSITGNTVILASRIEQLNKIYNSSFLISKDVLEEVYLQNIKPENLGKIQVKGRMEPVEVYKIL